MKPRLSHVDDHGNVRIVDVSGKDVTAREAVARGAIAMSASKKRSSFPAIALSASASRTQGTEISSSNAPISLPVSSPRSGKA